MPEPTSEQDAGMLPAIPDVLEREADRRPLARAANVALGVAVGGIPLTIYDVNGYGPSLMFVGFVLYLVLRHARSRM